MEEVLNLLSAKIDKAVEEIARLKEEIKRMEGEKAGLEKALNDKINEMEKEKGLIADDYKEKLSSVSEKISDVIKKLDKVI